MAPSAAPPSQTTPTASALFVAVEALKDTASQTFLDFEGDGDYLVLRDALAYIRDRADAIQSAVMGSIDAIATHL